MSFHIIRICVDFEYLSLVNRHTKPLVLPGLPVKLLTGFTAVKDKLASRAGLEQ